jgi:maleylpyruvate isomerase
MINAPAMASDMGSLRARLGKGARFDAPGAPAQALRLARHGMAAFARQLNTLSDDALTHASRVPGWSRAHVVAHVSIEARAQALILATLRGQALEDDFDWQPDVDLTATLPPRALRHLFDHAHVHVNVEWRDLLAKDWSRAVTLPPSLAVDVQDLPARQAALLWWGAVALHAAATESDIPAEVALPTGPLQAITQRPPHCRGR